MSCSRKTFTNFQSWIRNFLIILARTLFFFCQSNQKVREKFAKIGNSGLVICETIIAEQLITIIGAFMSFHIITLIYFQMFRRPRMELGAGKKRLSNGKTRKQNSPRSLYINKRCVLSLYWEYIFVESISIETKMCTSFSRLFNLSLKIAFAWRFSYNKVLWAYENYKSPYEEKKYHTS